MKILTNDSGYFLGTNSHLLIVLVNQTAFGRHSKLLKCVNIINAVMIK